MPDNSGYNLGNALGQLVMGNPQRRQDAFLQGQQAGALVNDRMASARKSRADAMLGEDRLTARQGITPEAMAQAGYSPDQAPLLGSILRANDSVKLADLGQLAIPQAGAAFQRAADAVNLGDMTVANRNLALAGGHPLETTKIADGTAYNAYADPGQTMHTTALGDATIGARKAQAAASYGQANAANAHARLFDKQTSVGGFNPNNHGTTVYDPGTGNPLVQIGGSPGPLTKTNQTNVQKDLIGAQDSLATLRKAGEQMRDEYLTAEGRGKALLGGMLDKAGVGGGLARFNAKRSQALLGVEQFFNAYRKEITGAAAAEQELQMLKKASIDGSVGPEEFWARYSGLMDLIQSGIQRNKARLGLPGGNLGDQVAGQGAGQTANPGLGDAVSGQQASADSATGYSNLWGN